MRERRRAWAPILAWAKTMIFPDRHQSSRRRTGRLGTECTNLGDEQAQGALLRRAILGQLLWRALLLGVSLHLVLTIEPEINLRLNFLSFVIASIWSYYDGLFAKGYWCYAWIEGAVLHLFAVQISNLLIWTLAIPWSLLDGVVVPQVAATGAPAERPAPRYAKTASATRPSDVLAIPVLRWYRRL